MKTKQIDKLHGNFSSIYTACKEILVKDKNEKRHHVMDLYSEKGNLYATNGKILIKIKDDTFEEGFYHPIVLQKSKIIFNFFEPETAHYPDVEAILNGSGQQFFIKTIDTKKDLLSAYVAEKTGSIYNNNYTNIAVSLHLENLLYKKDCPVYFFDNEVFENSEITFAVMPMQFKHDEIV